MSCSENYANKLDEELKKKFKNKFSSNYINKSILFLRKGVYLFVYMHDWEKVNEIKLPRKEEFYSNVNIEEITDADYMYGKRIFKNFEIKNLGEYFDLHLKSNTLLLAHVFQNFRNKCIKVYELDPVKFISTTGLAWKADLKKKKIRLELLADFDLFLMVEKGIRGGICDAIHQ